MLAPKEALPLPPFPALSTVPPLMLAPLPENVELVTVALPSPGLSALSMAPPSLDAVLPENVESETVMPPALPAPALAVGAVDGPTVDGRVG